jgi:pimeloyl-ACP methyl ester carboxylesterase
LGHSEGALVALVAAQKPQGICGIILVAGAGRKLGDVMRDQLRSNPANASLLDSALAAIGSLEQGKAVDVTAMPAPLQGLFAPQVQPFMIDLLAKDPAALISRITLPILVVQGGRDIQVSEDDARKLAAAQPKSKLVLIPGMNHVLKDVASDERAANLATYADPSLPVDPRLVDAITGFVKP